MARFALPIALLAGFAAASVATATCAPKTLVHIVAHDIRPGLDPHSYAAQRKVMFRIGLDRMRSEEAPDPEHRIQGVIVVVEPNVWMANLYDMSGRHFVDPGPSFVARAPIVTFAGVSPKIQSLELGCENDFIQSNAPRPVRTQRVGGRLYEVYRVDGGSDAVEVLEERGSSRPAFARYYRSGKLVLAVQYDLYRVSETNDPALFLPVPGVHYDEVSGVTSIDVGAARDADGR